NLYRVSHEAAVASGRFYACGVACGLPTGGTEATSHAQHVPGHRAAYLSRNRGADHRFLWSALLVSPRGQTTKNDRLPHGFRSQRRVSPAPDWILAPSFRSWNPFFAGPQRGEPGFRRGAERTAEHLHKRARLVVTDLVG